MPFCKISQEMRKQADTNRDYQVICHDNTFRCGLMYNAVPESVYRGRVEDLSSLLDQYNGCSIQDTFKGTRVTTKYGDCYQIEYTKPCTFPLHSREDIQKVLYRDLTLLTGIGKKRAAYLRQRGCRDVRDLVHSRRFAPYANASVQVIEAGGVPLIREVARWHGYSHPLTLLTSGLYPPESFLFLDIETLGIFSRPLFLIGTGVFNEGSIHVSQYLAEDIGQEAAVLEAFLQTVKDDTVFVSFNGKSFDLPYIISRLAFYGIDQVLPELHYDVLFHARHYLKKSLHDCRLTTLEEKILGISREMDIPGAMVPEWYEIYLSEQNPGPLVPIIHHNRQDIISLAELFIHFRELAYGYHDFS